MDGNYKRYFFLAAFYKYTFLAFTIMIISSCLPDPLEVKDVPAVEQEIVVASQIIPDGTLVVILTKTFGALEASGDSNPEELLNQIAVNDAQVTLTGPNGVQVLSFISSGFYGGISIPFQEGEEYLLEVVSPSMGSVYATTRVQPEVKFENVKADLYYEESDETYAQLSYTLRDQAGDSYYLLNVQEVELMDITENAINPRAFTKIFEDKGFDGGLFSEQFRVYPRNYEAGDTIAVSLAGLSKEYYKFLEMRLDNRSNFLEFVSEPVNYPTNIVGGRGFFNLHVPDFRFFVLGKEN